MIAYLSNWSKLKKSPSKRLHTLICCWNAFSFDYGTHLLCHICQWMSAMSQNVFLSSVTFITHPRSCIEDDDDDDYDNGVRMMRKAFSTTSQRLSIGLWFWTQWWCIHEWKWCLMSCSLNHPTAMSCFSYFLNTLSEDTSSGCGKDVEKDDIIDISYHFNLCGQLNVQEQCALKIEASWLPEYSE